MPQQLGNSFKPTKVAYQETTSGGSVGGYYKSQPGTAVSYDAGGNKPTGYISGAYAGPGTPSSVSYTGSQPSSSTVMTNANIIENVIPNLKNQYQNVMTPPSTYLPGNQSTGDDLYEQNRYVPSKEDQRAKQIEDEMMRTNDAAYYQQLENIKANFANLRKQQEQTNKAAEGGTMQALLMGGSSRYAPISSESINQAQKSYGIEQLGILSSQEASAIAAATEAYNTNKFSILEKELARIDKIRTEKNALAAKVAEAQAAELQEISARQRQMNQDLAVGDLISQGITDPYEILTTLSESGMGATAEEVNETLKQFTIKGMNPADIKSDYDLFSYFQANGKLPAGITSLPEGEQYFAWLNAQKLANSGKLGQAASIYGGTGGGTGGGSAAFVPGAGAKNGIEEQIIRDRMFITMQPLFNKGVLSESDRTIIEEKIANYRNAGYGEGEILAIFAGFPLDVVTPYNAKLAETIVATTPNADSQRETIAKVAVLLRNGNYGAAVRTVENQAIKRAIDQGVINKDAFATEDDVKYVQQKVGEINKLLGDDWVNSVGAFTGTFNQWLSKRFGLFKAAQIKAKLSSLTADMINKRAGSAITDTEWARLIEPSIPSMNDAASTWRVKLGEAENNVLQRYNSGREVAALPPITAKELNPESRVQLYATKQTDDFWGADTSEQKSFLITDGFGSYNIPEGSEKEIDFSSLKMQ